MKTQLDGYGTKRLSSLVSAVAEERDRRAYRERDTERDAEKLGAAERDAEDGEPGQERDRAASDARGYRESGDRAASRSTVR